MLDDLIARTIVEIRADREHGASWLAQRGADLLEQVIRSLLDSGATSDDTHATLLGTCRQVARARPSMAALVALASRVAATSDLADALAAITAMRVIWRDAPERIAAHLGPLLGEQAYVVTISRSATVTAALVGNRVRISHVTVLESRPGGEGARTASDLVAAGMPSVRLVPDAAMLDALATATVVIAGADAILPDHWAANKIGTGALAVLAATQNVPVFLTVDTTKIAPAGWEWRSEAADPTMMISQPDPGVVVSSPLFERVALDGVTLVTERGVLDGNAVARIANELAIPGGERLLPTTTATGEMGPWSGTANAPLPNG